MQSLRGPSATGFPTGAASRHHGPHSGGRAGTRAHASGIPWDDPSGDLPPRRECADLWLDLWLARMPHIEPTLLVGQYAQRHFLGARRKASRTKAVRAWRTFGPNYIPLPHPSPRNTPWFQRNPWFAQDLLPLLKQRDAALHPSS